MVSAIEAAPAAKPAPTSEMVTLQEEVATLERSIATFKRSNPNQNAWTTAQTQLFNRAQTQVKSMADRLTSLETELAKKADLTYVDTALKGKANVGDGYTKGEIDTKLENLLAGESLPWWAKLLMGAIALLAGYAAFFRKALAPAAIDTSNFVTSTELEALASKVEVIQSRFKHWLMERSSITKFSLMANRLSSRVGWSSMQQAVKPSSSWMSSVSRLQVQICSANWLPTSRMVGRCR
jgi:hypothetical protein